MSFWAVLPRLPSDWKLSFDLTLYLTSYISNVEGRNLRHHQEYQGYFVEQKGSPGQGKDVVFLHCYKMFTLNKETSFCTVACYTKTPRAVEKTGLGEVIREKDKPYQHPPPRKKD